MVILAYLAKESKINLARELAKHLAPNPLLAVGFHLFEAHADRRVLEFIKKRYQARELGRAAANKLKTGTSQDSS